MPAFNRAKVLKETIRQVLDQTFADFELIIFNDGSTDNTIEVIKEFDDNRISFIDSINLGPPHPLNEILKLAKGEFVIILHDHDFFDRYLIEKSVAALEKYPAAGFVLQGSAWIAEDGVSGYQEMLLDLPELNNGKIVGIQILKSSENFNSMFHACCMVRRNWLERAGNYYDSRFGLYADTDLWLRLLLISDFVYLKEVLFKFRTREKEGHFLTGKEFVILDWLSEIHFTNGKRYFTNQKDCDTNQRLIAKKLDRQRQRLIVSYAANNKLELVKMGLTRCKDDQYGHFFLSAIFKVAYSNDFILKAFVRMLSLLKNVKYK